MVALGKAKDVASIYSIPIGRRGRDCARQPDVQPDAQINVGSGTYLTVMSDNMPRFIEGRDIARV